jgi:hypothetical protein
MFAKPFAHTSSSRCSGVVTLLAALMLLVVAPSVAVAQEAPGQEKPGSIVWSVTKGVLFDPTTYAPALIAFKTQQDDWKTSQILFQAGWVEQNDRFTISGRPNDRPISFEAGNQQIRRDALDLFKTSVVNNVVVGLTERALIARYPQHRKLLRTLGWIERIGFASYVSYLASVEHVRQTRRNQQLARDYGYVAR